MLGFLMLLSQKTGSNCLVNSIDTCYDDGYYALIHKDLEMRLKMELPIKFLSQMKDILGDQYSAFYNSFDSPRHYGLRLNQLKTDHHLITRLPFKCEEVAWCSNGYYYEETDRPAKDPYYMAGCYYIQEPSAMTPGVAVDAKPGEKIIDLCAAPGGKSTQIASAMNQVGVLVSNDISPSRVKNLHKNLQLSGVRNAIVLSENPNKIASAWPGYFDKVLVDAPCSGEGMFRKDPKLIHSWEENGPNNFVPIQQEILKAAALLLKEGGEIIYSTCTYNHEENEKMIQWFLDQHPGYEVVKIHGLDTLEDGFVIDQGNGSLRNTKRAWPHLVNGEGHFIAKLKKFENEAVVLKSVRQKALISKNAFEAITEFNKGIGYEMPKTYIERLHEHLDKIYVIPEDGPMTQGLRVFSSGWYIGDMKKQRFEPSQAYASALAMNEVSNKVDYNHDDHNLIKYLKGDTVEVSADNGWHLVGVEGASIGWGKVVNGRLKNKLEPSWRWL
jgi:NOL1/NOP2/sun family putative RNA methylase